MNIEIIINEGGKKIKIIEEFIKGKVSKDLCEDASYISDNFIAVIDGVTSKSNFIHKGKTTGKIASEILLSTLKNINKDATVDEFIELANQTIHSFYKNIDFPYSKKEKGVQAVCTVYSNYHREIWIIGDCEVLVDGKSYSNPKKSDDVLADMRSLILEVFKLENPSEFHKMHTQQMARDVIEPWILKSNIFANNSNTAYGYAVVNGEDIPSSLIKKIKLDNSAHEIVLASDGYPKLQENLEKSEEYLKKIIKEDKECCNLYKSTKGLEIDAKSYDDRTYIRFLVD